MKVEMHEIEDQIKVIFEAHGSQIFPEDVSGQLKVLEQRKAELLLHEEQTWRLKSHAIWIKEGDKNSK